jgi:2-polyprenyl-6-methoxyphenol hydroxylase-like FAD-dependent oxidoreductase
MSFKVAILGAGPAGCTLARLLQHESNKISVTIFEAEASLDVRSQGGSLDLHETTGQAALKKAGLWAEFQKHARYDGEALKIADKNLLCYIRMNGAPAPSSTSQTAAAPGGRPEIDRPLLREMLSKSLLEGTIQWSKKVSNIDEDLHIHFTDGTTRGDFDLIVGSDGAWSKARPYLSDVKPFYSGMAGHSMTIENAEETHPELFKLVNRGSLFTFSDGKSLMGQYNGNGNIVVSTWSKRAANWQSTYDVNNAGAVRKASAEEYAGWHPDLVALLHACNDKVVPRDLFMLPVGHSWPHRRGVTLIGDAAHVMTPFAGEGVNLAMEDAMKLADAILSATSPASATEAASQALDQAVAGFERDMFKRATLTQQMTMDMMNFMFNTPDAPRSCIAPYTLRAVRGPSPTAASWFLTPLVYAWFAVFKLIW